MLDAAFSPTTCGGTDGCLAFLVNGTNCGPSLVTCPPGVAQTTISSMPFTPPFVAGHLSVAMHFMFEVPGVEVDPLVVVVVPGVPDVVVVEDALTLSSPPFPSVAPALPWVLVEAAAATATGECTAVSITTSIVVIIHNITFRIVWCSFLSSVQLRLSTVDRLLAPSLP
jgi:hypothetical protein